MQSPAENHLVHELDDFLREKKGRGSASRILNIGAGKKVIIEQELSRLGCEYTCDRIDSDDCSVLFPTVGHSRMCSVEDMAALGSNAYAASFANFVLEHVSNLPRASREVYRVLSPSGIFVASVPNPVAPEFVLARRTPLWLHRLVRRGETWETYYSYRSIRDLVGIFEASGFIVQDISYWACLEVYLWRYPVLNVVGRLYDRLVSASGIRGLMGHVCVTFRKPS